MEITLKVVLTADPVLLSTLQALTALKNTGDASPASTATVIEKPKKVTTAKGIVDVASPAATKSSTENEVKQAGDNGAATSLHTIESLRALAVPKSKAGHKDVIKKWLADAGYQSLQDLQEKDFNSFHAFIDKL